MEWAAKINEGRRMWVTPGKYLRLPMLQTLARLWSVPARRRYWRKRFHGGVKLPGSEQARRGDPGDAFSAEGRGGRAELKWCESAERLQGEWWRGWAKQRGGWCLKWAVMMMSPLRLIIFIRHNPIKITGLKKGLDKCHWYIQWMAPP